MYVVDSGIRTTHQEFISASTGQKRATFGCLRASCALSHHVLAGRILVLACWQPWRGPLPAVASDGAAAACRVDFIGNFSQSSPIQDCERSPLDMHGQYTEESHTHASNCEVAAPRSLACVKAIFEQVMGMAHMLLQLLLAETWALQRRLMWWLSECWTVRQAAIPLSSQYPTSRRAPPH